MNFAFAKQILKKNRCQILFILFGFAPIIRRPEMKNNDEEEPQHGWIATMIGAVIVGFSITGVILMVQWFITRH